MMVVVDAQYIDPSALDMAVQRKTTANSNGNFTVVDANGNLMFKIKDRRFSLHDRHILFDANDKVVLTFKKKLRSIHGRWQAFKGESTSYKDMLFSVKKSSTPTHETELDVFLVENKEETVCDCKVIGDWEKKSCTIYAQDGSTSLAEVHDKQTITSIEAAKDSFGITVYPEVDYVFIVALVLILNEIKKSYEGSGKKKKKKTKKKGKKSSDSSDDDSKKVKEKEDEEKEEREKHKGKKEQEEQYGDEEEEDDDYDSDDDDDSYSDEDDDDGNYEEEPKYDEYNDDDDDNEDDESSFDEDQSPRKPSQ